MLRAIFTGIICFILTINIAHAESVEIVSEATQECLECHATLHPGIVQEWRKSRHALISPRDAQIKEKLSRRISNPNIDQTPVDSDLLRPGLVVFDIVYNPIKTRLLREAEIAGAKTISGVDMLVWQGALAFEKWTGRKAPVELMREETIKLLQGHEN